ncbi:MAG: hypothetical protein ACK5EO_13935 [Planctomycetota bacterium]
MRGHYINHDSWDVAPGYDEYRRWRKNVSQLLPEHLDWSHWPKAMHNIARGLRPWNYTPVIVVNFRTKPRQADVWYTCAAVRHIPAKFAKD